MSIPAINCASLQRGGFLLDALRMILQAQRPFLSLLEELYIANKGALPLVETPAVFRNTNRTTKLLALL